MSTFIWHFFHFDPFVFPAFLFWGQCSCGPAGPEQLSVRGTGVSPAANARWNPAVCSRQAGREGALQASVVCGIYGVWIAEPPGAARLFLFSDSMETKVSAARSRDPYATHGIFISCYSPGPVVCLVSANWGLRKVGRGGGEDVWWRRCGRAEEDSSKAPPGPRLNPAALGPPGWPRRSALSAHFPLLSWGVWQPVCTWGGPRASVREDVRALLGEVQGPCPSWGLWPAHCLRLSSRAGGWAPVGGSGALTWRSRWWAWTPLSFLFINYFFKLSYSNWRIVTLL